MRAMDDRDRRRPLWPPASLPPALDSVVLPPTAPHQFSQRRIFVVPCHANSADCCAPSCASASARVRWCRSGNSWLLEFVRKYPAWLKAGGSISEFAILVGTVRCRCATECATALGRQCSRATFEVEHVGGGMAARSMRSEVADRSFFYLRRTVGLSRAERQVTAVRAQLTLRHYEH